MTSNIELLAQYFSGSPKKLGPNSADIAKFILLNAETKSTSYKSPTTGGNKPSLMGRIFDILSRPNYAVANFANKLVEGNVDPGAIWKGLSGEEKTTFQDVLKNLGMPQGVGTSVLGLGLDIALDPTTYIPVAGIASKIKNVARPTKEIAELPLSKKLLSEGEPVHPEAFGLPSSPSHAVPLALQRPTLPAKPVLPKTSLSPSKELTTSQLTLPGMPGRLKLPEITYSPTKLKTTPPVGQLSLKFPNLKKTKASDIVTRVSQGDPSSVIRTLPIPKPQVEGKHASLATTLLEKWDNSKFRSRLNEKFPETLNARQQAELFKSAVNLVKTTYKKPGNKRVYDIAYRVYIAAEKVLESKGLVPRIHTGENVRLSDVIQHLGGPDRAQEVIKEFEGTLYRGSPTWQAVQSLRASGAIKESKTVQSIAEEAGDLQKAIETRGSFSQAQQNDLVKLLKKYSAASARAEDVSPSGISAAEKLVDFTLKSGKTAVQLALDNRAKVLDDIISTGRSSKEINGTVTRALEKDLGKLPHWIANDNKAAEFLMGRVATWWGQKDLRPFSLNAIGSAAATAAARGKALDSLFRGSTLTQRHEAFRLAQGIGQSADEKSIYLAFKLQQMMSNLVGRAGATSTLMRSSIPLNMLNRWLGRYHVDFKFTNGKVKDLTGKTVDYSQGSSWLDSWKTAILKEDPQVFLFKLQQALEQATREKALFDEIGERFGSVTLGKGYKNKIEGHPYLEGYYFTDDIAKQIPRVIKDWSIPTWNSNNPLLRHYDRVMSMWKSGVTIYRPAHHIRNMIGDVYLGWMDGVNTVRPYMLAAQVQRSLRGMYQDLLDIDKLVELGLASRNLATPKPNQILFKNKSGVGFSAEQIAAVAHQKGLLEHARTIEDIIDLGEQGRGILNVKPFGGKVQAVARGASELQSHNARLAHFIDKVMKSRGGNLEEIFEQASRRARKWHPTGLDLTDYERKVLRRIIPFYSWLRKSTPLLIEGMVMNPGKVIIPSKLNEAIQESQGIETPGRQDPFPVDQMFPQWIRSQGLGPVSSSDGLLGGVSNQMPPGYVLGGVGLNPLTQLVSQLETPGRSIATSLTPAIQIPLELATGRKLFSGEPISGPEARPGALEQYTGEQIPFFGAIQGITGITPFGGETKKAQRAGSPDMEALLNWLTGAGIKGTGPYINQARFERNQPKKVQRKVSREQFLQELRNYANS
jgi:hypothetical protein